MLTNGGDEEKEISAKIETPEDALRFLTNEELSYTVPFLTPFQDDLTKTYFVNCVVCAKKLTYALDFFKTICFSLRGRVMAHPFCETCTFAVPKTANCCNCDEVFRAEGCGVSTAVLRYHNLPIAASAFGCCSVECDKTFVNQSLKKSCKDVPINVNYECGHCKKMVKREPQRCRRCDFTSYCSITCLVDDAESHRALCDAVVTRVKKTSK